MNWKIREKSAMVYFQTLFYYFSRVEAGYNTSTIALRVVEGDEKNPVPGCITGPPCHWGI
jgi:hypothetical protein